MHASPARRFAAGLAAAVLIPALAALARRFAAGPAAAVLIPALAAAQPAPPEDALDPHAAETRRQAARAAPPAPPEDALDFHAAAPDLRAYVTAAVERNPAVLESRARYEAALRRAPRVAALPDPVVNFTQALRSVETRVGPQINGVTLTQAFPWFGTLALRGRVARLEAQALGHLHQAARRDVAAEVKEVYYDLGYVDAALGLAREEQSLLAHYETLAGARYAAGEGLLQAVIRLQAEITRVVDRRRRLDRRRAVLAARLNTLRDRPVNEPVPAVPRPARPAFALDRGRLHRLGERNRHELRAAGALVEGGERAVELAGRSARPGFTASVGVVNVGRRTGPADLPPLPDDGRNALTVSLGVSVPLWRAKYRAEVEQADAELRARIRRREAARNAVELEVHDAIVRIETLDGQIGLFDDVLIPQAEEALRATEAAYGTGRLGVLELLDGERTLIDVRELRARHLSDLLIALTALERAVGARVPGTGSEGAVVPAGPNVGARVPGTGRKP